MNQSVPAGASEADFFQIGGTLKANAPSYIERPADRELYECLLSGKYAYVLTPRQMGKSSLMTRTAARLRQEGVHVAVADLTGIGGDAGSMSADEWYYGLANKMLRQLDISYDLVAWWKQQILLPPLNRLMNFFQDVVLTLLDGKIVVFVDEIDTTIKLSFSDDFFAAIRACFNARADQAAFDRICFVLLGVASPADLIRDPTRTPFNIGRRIDLGDFDCNEARHFVRGLPDGEGVAERLLKRVLYWSNGHPYLTQKLCLLARSGGVAGEAPEVRVDRVVKAEFLGEGRRAKEDNLKLIDDRIAKAETHRLEMLKVYAKVRKGKRIQDQPQSPIHSALKLSGLVKTDEQGRLAVRNEIYKRVFDARWINRLMPGRWKRRAAIASTLMLTLSGAVFGWWIGAQQLTVASGRGIILAYLGIAYPEPEMVEIPAGNFQMGSPEYEEGRYSDEGPQHRVSISKSFFMSTHEVTFDEYDVFAFLIKHDGGCADGHEVIRPSDNGWGRGKLPVINVSWEDADCYAEWLSRKTGKYYRLPTEAEWEYACRAGTTTPFSFGANITPEQVNYNGDYSYADGAKGLNREKTVPVKSLPANPWGLYEMHGNVWEWCADWYGDYAPEAVVDPVGPLEGSLRVLRGGSWIYLAGIARSADRLGYVPASRNDFFGFRLALGQEGASGQAGQGDRRAATGRTAAAERGGQAGRSAPDGETQRNQQK
jgi:formylglycine-generating enzyme required for sulfatase activity